MVLRVAHDDTATEVVLVLSAEHKVVRHFVPLANSIYRCGFLSLFSFCSRKGRSTSILKRRILEQK